MITGTSVSIEWHEGPYGPNTLCNSCGPRWANIERLVKLGYVDDEGASVTKEALQSGDLYGEENVCADCGMSIQTHCSS
jgi:hypothetical protein